MRTLFIMDPLEKIVIAGDSTYITMRECTDRGYDVWFCTPDALYSQDGEVWAFACPVKTTSEAPYFHPKEGAPIALHTMNIVWMRKDPPFDIHYIFCTYLLDMVPSSTLVVNDPTGLRSFNEKMWVSRQWPHLQPKTLVSNNIKQLRNFVTESPGRAVIKPWDGNGGRGALVVSKEDRNLSSMLEMLSAEGHQYVIAQHFIEGAEDGDKRILLFDGEPVGAILRIPSRSDYRANMHVGASVVACELSSKEKEICAELGPELKKKGMYFVGIDVIAGKLTEVNVTSPTGIREVNQLEGRALEAELVDCVERAFRERT